MAFTTSALAQDFYKGFDAYMDEDYATALQEWRPLAEQGDADAQTNLGFMYGNGNGVLQDDTVAHMWYRMAAAKGHDKGQTNMDVV